MSPTSSIRSSLEKSHVPLTNYDLEPASADLEDGNGRFERQLTRLRRKSWWRNMSLGAGTRYQDVEGQDGLESPGVLSDLYPMERRRKRQKNCLNYLVFGGISGCTIL